MSAIRLAVDALVEHQGQVLLVEYENAALGHHFGLPGGGVEANETIHAALQREVFEETGAEVSVGKLLLVNELQDEEHELRLIFHCTLCDKSIQPSPTQPDSDQIGIVWQPLDHLHELLLFPAIGTHLLASLRFSSNQDLFNTTL